MPQKGSNKKFTVPHKQLKASFVIYADYESILPKVCKINRNNPNEIENEIIKPL